MRKELLNRFYCFSIPGIMIGIVLITILWGLLRKRLEEKRLVLWISFILFLCGFTVILYITLGNRNVGSKNEICLIPLYSYVQALRGGNPEIYRSNFMNVILFYPVGLLATSLLPQKWKGWCRFILVVLALTAVSVGIEFLQYRYALGRCEIDDVIHNALGALLGSLAFVCSMYFLEKKKP